MTISKDKRARKNALRRRLDGASPPPAPGAQPRPDAPPLAAPPSPSQAPRPAPQAEGEAQKARVLHPIGGDIRRLAAGRAGTDDWSTADKVRGARPVADRGKAGQEKGRQAAGFDGRRHPAGDGGEAADVLRDHEWVMERVKMRKREESRRRKGSSRARAKAGVWLPSSEQVSPAASQPEGASVARLVVFPACPAAPAFRTHRQLRPHFGNARLCGVSLSTRSGPPSSLTRPWLGLASRQRSSFG